MVTMRELRNKLDEMNVKYEVSENGNIGFFQTGDKNFRYFTIINLEDDAFRFMIYTGIELMEYNFKTLNKINEYNMNYKWYKFFIEEDKNELMMTSYLNNEYIDDVEQLIGLIIVGGRILNHLYPDIQRFMWNS